MNSYQRAKIRARNMAIEWHRSFCDHNYSYGELISWRGYFHGLAKRCGLVEEFKENGII